MSLKNEKLFSIGTTSQCQKRKNLLEVLKIDGLEEILIHPRLNRLCFESIILVR